MHPDFFRHPFTKLLTLVFIMVTSFFVLFILSYLLAIPLFGLSFAELSNILSGEITAEHTAIIKYFQIIQTIGLFVLPPFLAVRYFSDRPLQYLGFDKRPGSWSWVAVIVLIWMAVPFINFLTELNQEIQLPEIFGSTERWLMNREESARQITGKFLQADTLSMLALNLFMVALLPSVGEELIFRGIIQKVLTQWTRNAHLGILIAAFLFSAMHVQFYGLIPRMFLGVLFGYLFLWSGSVWLPILGHFINNASAVIYYYVSQEDASLHSSRYDSLGIEPSTVVISGVLIVLCCLVVYMDGQRLKE